MGYADTDLVKRLIGPTAATWGADDLARIAALDEAVSLVFEDKTGRTFGIPSAAALRYVDGAGTDTLVLPVPIRTITSVVVNPTAWSGSAYTGGVTLASTYYVKVPNNATADIWLMRRIDGGVWYGPVAITGSWADTDADTAVPEDVVYAISRLVAETWKAEQASPAGFTGPDGMTVPIRDPWKDSLIAAVISRHAEPVGLVV